jgi:hypothetical protein
MPTARASSGTSPPTACRLPTEAEWLEALHRAHARVEDRIRCGQGHRLSPATLTRVGQHLINQSRRDVLGQHSQPHPLPYRPVTGCAAAHHGIICSHEAPV